MSTLRIVLLGFLVSASTALAQQTVEVSVTDYDGLRREIDRANGRPPGTRTVIDIPRGQPIRTEEDVLRIRSDIEVTGGRFLESLLDSTTTNLFIVEPGARLRVEGSEFVDWSHAGAGPNAFANRGELILNDVTITSIYGVDRGFGLGGCIPHSGSVIINDETGSLRIEDSRIRDSGGRIWMCGAGPGNGILTNRGTAEIVDTHVLLTDNDWDVPFYNSGTLSIRDSSFVVLNGEEDPSLSLLHATESARTEFANSTVGGFARDEPGLSDGGASGLYYDPDHDGHYVYVLDNDSNTLLVWNTFDIHGNQAWVLAIGQLYEGRFMRADAWTNEHGVLTGEGPVGADRDLFWGTLVLELDSCEGGTLTFSSALPDFTSGQFELKRLAFVKQVGCRE